MEPTLAGNSLPALSRSSNGNVAQASQQLACQAMQLPPFGVVQNRKDPLQVGYMVREDALDQLEPGRRQGYQYAAAVTGMLASLDQTGLLEPIYATGHAAGGDHRALVEHRRRKGIGFAGAAQCRQDVELAGLQVVLGKEGKQMITADQLAQLAQTADHGHGEAIQIRPLLLPLLGSQLCAVLHATSIYLAIKILFKKNVAMVMHFAKGGSCMSQPHSSRAVALLLGIGALLGLTSNMVKLAGQQGWTPLAFLLWSLLGSGLTLLMLARVQGETPGLAPRLQRYYLLSGLLSISLPNGLLFSSIPHVGAGFASMCLAFPPLITYLLSLMLRMEGLSRLRLLGITIGLIGSLLLALGKLHAGDSPTLWVLAALCVPLFLALGNVYRSRHWPSDASPLSLAPGMLFGGALLLLPLSLLGVDLAPRFDSPSSVSLLFVQVALFALVYGLFFVLQKLAGAVFLSQIGSVAALVGTAVAVGMLGERGSLSMLLAGACIVTGILLASRRREHEAAA